MASDGVDRHPRAQCLHDLLDGFRISEEIIGVVHDVDSRVVAQLVDDRLQGSGGDELSQLGSRVARLQSPCRQRDRFEVPRERHILDVLKPLPDLALGR